MFCPIGFHHFHTILWACDGAGIQLVPYAGDDELVFRDDDPDEIDYERSAGERRVIITNRIMDRFITKYADCGYAFSPDKQIVRLSRYALMPMFFNHFRTFDYMFSTYGNLFRFIDDTTGTLDPAGHRKRVDQIQSDPLVPKTGFPYVSKVCAALQPLQGWSVCFKEDECEISIPALMALHHSQHENFPSNGRPRLQERAYETYKRLYPYGHGKLTWKEVILELERNGCSVSPDTLKRAISSNSEETTQGNGKDDAKP